MNTQHMASKIRIILVLLTAAFWWSATMARCQTPTVSVYPTSVVVGDTAVISWSNGTGNPGDCISICKPDGSPFGWCFLNGTTAQPTTSPKSGSLTLQVPEVAGSCLVQYFSGATKSVVASCTLRTAPVGSLPHVDVSPYFNANCTYSAGSVTKVNLSRHFNLTGIYVDGSTFTGGIDGGGNAISASALSANLAWTYSAFAFGRANQFDVVSASSQSISLPAGKFHALGLLATAVEGSKPDQKFTVTYADGTSTAFGQSVSDWFYPQGYANETSVITMPYRLGSNGTKNTGIGHIFVYPLLLDSTKTVKSLILPNNSNLIIIAVSLM